MKLDALIEKMRGTFLTKEIFEAKFTPIERIVYGFVGMILVTVATGIIAVVVKVKP